MSYLSDLLGDAYKEGMTEEEISEALEKASKPTKPVNEDADTKWKERLSKANSEAASYKKRLREMQTAEQAAAEEQKELFEQLQNENAELKKSISLAEKKATLISQGYDDELATSTATAMVNGDMETVLANMATRAEAIRKEATADGLRSTPRPPAGSESASAVNYDKMIEQARAEGNVTAEAYYTRLAQTVQAE